MGDLTPVIAGAIAAILGILGGALNARRLRKLGVGEDMAKVLAAKTELVATWEAKYEIVEQERDEERAAHSATREELRLERDAGNRCRRELDDARSELRTVSRRRQPRVGG